MSTHDLNLKLSCKVSVIFFDILYVVIVLQEEGTVLCSVAKKFLMISYDRVGEMDFKVRGGGGGSNGTQESIVSHHDWPT